MNHKSNIYSLIVAVVSLSATVTFANTDRLIEALIIVESGGDDAAVGDGGKAIGCLQIWPITVRDANRILNAPVFNLADRLDREASKEMCRVVMTHYETTLEGMAKRWNCGGDWRNMTVSENYWHKVRKELK